MLLEKKLPLAYIFNKVKYDLLIITFVGLGTHFLAAIFEHVLPLMPPYIPTLLGTSISILLSFKMNQSYDRWWEARKIWGAIVNDSRTLVMQLQSLTCGDDGRVKTMAYRQMAFCYSLGQALRGLDPVEGISGFLSEGDLQDIARHKNVPLALLQLNTNTLKEMKENKEIDAFYHVQLDNTLLRLCDSMGKAERIKSTIFPATYRLFLHFIIYVFVITLSVSLNDIDTIFEIPLLVVVASCFFLIEKSAYHMQDPFGNRPSDTAVTAIARTVEINIRQLLGETEIPDPVAPSGFYLM